MVTDRTPPHKRISRAEKARDDWKAKATSRREEIQRLNAILKAKNIKINQLTGNIDKLNTSLTTVNDELSKRDATIEKFKKKSPKRK